MVGSFVLLERVGVKCRGPEHRAALPRLDGKAGVEPDNEIIMMHTDAMII